MKIRIKYLVGPKSGQIVVVNNSQEFQTLAASGFIEIIPYKNYQERLAAEMPKPVATVVQWGVQHVTAPGESQPRNVIVIKTVNGDQTIYDAPPKDCPPDVVAKFRREAAVYAQIVQDRQHYRKVDNARRA